MTARTRPRVAIAHDYLTQRGGAERVVLAMARAFPEAPIYTTLYEPSATYPEFQDLEIVVSPINRVGLLRRKHRAALPALPYAVSRLAVDADVVVASSSGWAHGVPTTGKKLVYCHAPARWLYQEQNYLGARSKFGAHVALRALRPWLLHVDRSAAASADRYLANSRSVRGHIRDAYDIDAVVLPPPMGLTESGPQQPVDSLVDWAAGYHLVVSRLLPYKNVAQAIEAFRGMTERLVIVGTGPLEQELRRRAPVNVRFVSGLGDAQLRWIYQHCRALVAPSNEDFGLTPLEAGMFGKPAVALHRGGYLDSVLDGQTGLFFQRPEPVQIRRALEQARSIDWDAERIREHSSGFSEARFREALCAEVDALLCRPTTGPGPTNANSAAAS